MLLRGVTSSGVHTTSLLSSQQTQIYNAITGLEASPNNQISTQPPEPSNLWNQFWQNFEWKEGVVSLSAIAGGLLTATLLYKQVKLTGITKVLDKTAIGDFYKGKRDSFINNYGNKAFLAKGNEKITVQSFFDQFTSSERKKYLQSFIKGDYEAVQQTINEISNKFQIPSKNLKTLIAELDEHSNLQFGDSISDKVNWQKGKPFFGNLTEITKEQLAGYGINYNTVLKELMENNSGSFQSFASKYVDQAAGRMSSLILAYTLISIIGNQIIDQSQQGLSDEEKKEIQQRKEATADPLGFIEDIFLMLAGGATGFGLGKGWKLKGLPLKLSIGVGAMGGFALAQLIHNFINFTYKKVHDNLPPKYKDSISIKTLVTILMGTFIGTLVSAKAIFAKYIKFTSAINNKGLRPSSNVVIHGLYRYSSNLSNRIAARLVGINERDIAKALNNPAQSGHLFTNPYNYLVHVMKGRDELVKKINQKNKTAGAITKLIDYGMDAIYDFPLLRKMAEKHPNGNIAMNGEFWARSSGDMVYKFVGVGLLNFAFLMLFSPLIYVGNLFSKPLRSTFKKEQDS